MRSGRKWTYSLVQRKSNDKVKRETRERIIPRVAAPGDDKGGRPIRSARMDTCGLISRLTTRRRLGVRWIHLIADGRVMLTLFSHDPKSYRCFMQGLGATKPTLQLTSLLLCGYYRSRHSVPGTSRFKKQ